ncbi:MAG: hypothetical protein NVSMB33_12970 [Ktedonobacteraceae bacterium]
MYYLVAGDILSALGQTAAIILLLYLMILILIGVALRLVLMLGLTWVREKAELIKRLRPTVNSVNTTTEAAIHGTLPASQGNKVVRTVAEVPVYARTVDQKVEQGSDKVAAAVIEFRARTEMAKGMLKAFFLPGLSMHRKTVLEEEGIGFRSPGYRMLLDEQTPGDESAGYGQGYAGVVSASQLKGASVTPVVSPPKEIQPITVTTTDAPSTR